MAEGGIEDTAGKKLLSNLSLSESQPFSGVEHAKEVLQTLAKDVKDRCDEELQHHRSCGQPGAPPCLLDQTLQSLDTAVCVDQFTPQAISIRDTVKGLIQVITDKVASFNPYFQCQMHCKGSSFNGLKIGRADEFDFMLELVKFSVGESGRWKVVSDEKRFSRPGSIYNIHRKQAVGLENLYQIQLQHSDREQEESNTCDGEEDVKPTTGDRTFEKMYNILLTEREVLGQCLSADEIKGTFASLLEKACDLLSVAKNSRDETCIRASVKGSGKLLLFLPNVEYAVKVDLTPCVKAEPVDSPSLFIVPSMSVDSWVVANEDPVELSNAKVSQTIRIFKTLKDIIEYDHRDLDFDSTCLSHDLIFLFHESASAGNYVLQDMNSRMLIDLCSLPVLGQLTSAVPSYGIMGTVAKCFRQHPNFSVCALIFESIKEFKFVDPKDVPLLTREWEGHALDMNCILYDMVSTLLDLKVGQENLAPLLKHNLPPWFRCSHQVLTRHIRENFEAIETVLWEGQTSSSAEDLGGGSDRDGCSTSRDSDGAGNEPSQTRTDTEHSFTVTHELQGAVCVRAANKSQKDEELEATEDEVKQPGVARTTCTDIGIYLDAEDSKDDEGQHFVDHFEVYQLKKQDFVSILTTFPLLEAAATIIGEEESDEGSETLYVVVLKPENFCVRNVCFTMVEGFDRIEGNSIKAVIETFGRKVVSNTVVIKSEECFWFPGLS